MQGTQHSRGRPRSATYRLLHRRFCVLKLPKSVDVLVQPVGVFEISHRILELPDILAAAGPACIHFVVVGVLRMVGGECATRVRPYWPGRSRHQSVDAAWGGMGGTLLGLGLVADHVAHF